MNEKLIDINKLEFIENYFYNHLEDDFFYIVLHSLFNCISELELQIFYFEYAKGNPALKKTIESYVLKRTSNEPKRQFNNVAITLLRNYTNEDYSTQTTTRTFLSQFIRTLPTETIQMFFDLLINSERKFDRHRANEVADLILTDEIKEKLLENFHKYNNEYSLLPLINNFDEEELCLIIEEYWTSEFPSPRIKREILKKLLKLELEYFSFLKERDISYYFQILNLKKIKITDKEINELLKSVTEENKFYLLWTIGMTGNWKQTTKYIEKINKRANI